MDEGGSPIPGARVHLWEGGTRVGQEATGPDGAFEFQAELGAAYSLYAFADIEATAAYDYAPSRAEVVATGADEVVMTLGPGASVIVEGDIQFVESEDLPSSLLLAVVDPATGEALESNGFPLLYGSDPESQGQYLELEANHVIVPAGRSFRICVNFSMLVRSEIVTRTFEIDEPSAFTMEAGEQLRLDVRRYHIPHNLEHLDSLQGTVNIELDELDSIGFYIATERKVAEAAARLLSDAEFLYGEGLYLESYTACKRCYLDLAETRSRLSSMARDARISVYSIAVFLALTSTAVAFLLSNRDSTKAVGSVGVYAAALAFLYSAYPGSAIVPLESFVSTGLVAMASSLAVAIVLPRFMKARGGDGHLPVRNILVPIFSMAKRSIRRRRLRFALTLISIAVMVMSFVSLTSFSEGYGLVVRRVSAQGGPREGVLIRAQTYTEAEPTFLSERDVYSGWLERQPEGEVVSPKAENVPLIRPMVQLEGLPIYGILGIEPELERSITPLEAYLVEGGLPSEHGVVVSESLREALGAELGDALSLGGVELELVGVIEDDSPGRLRELDGSPYLPKKMVDINPEGEVPQYVLERCEPSEYVILHVSDALGMALVGISRVAISVGGGVDARSFSERLALERGYLSWSASPEGLYTASLGAYFEGKGLPLLVPWAIVVLNVVVTMLNSMFERRREIHILSSVGLNPAQISAVFVAEASIIGLTAGGLGYLGGLGVYKGMALAGLSLEVRQKVSAVWSLASIGIAMTAVLMGAFASLRRSVVITPSLMRRWRFEEQADHFEPFEMTIPVRLLREEVDGFVEFVVGALLDLGDNPDRSTSSVKLLEAEGEEIRIDFVYKSSGAMTSNFYTKNSLLVERGGGDGEAVVRLRSYGDHEWAHVTGSLVRMLAVRWSTSK